ncbi:unnamed protein product [Peronospora belbahrii]|uniref:Uncharacterized protein n=1 Tax=Peronospora belbahrii TaxID=622444 RepID=A0AAU9L2H2_9STRA|nr:unnamed protein product [Peronospora belbahrii]
MRYFTGPARITSLLTRFLGDPITILDATWAVSQVVLMTKTMTFVCAVLSWGSTQWPRHLCYRYRSQIAESCELFLYSGLINYLRHPSEVVTREADETIA